MTDSTIQRRRLLVIFWLLAVVLGLLYTWRAFYDLIDPDSIAYLEMGEAFLRRDWQMAINAYWSPFYPWLLAAALYVLHPPRSWQFAVVPLVDFAVYLGMLGCFHFFAREVLRRHRAQRAACSSPQAVLLPEWVVFVVAYTLFLWVSFEWLGMGSFVASADKCVAAFVYVAAGLLVRMRSASRQGWTWILFGVVLGGGYLAKAAMFPLAFVFLASSLGSGGPFRRKVWRGLTACMAFLVIASPWMLALSQAKGYLTFGLAGKLNYAWMVNGLTRHIHWQGEPPGSGIPCHPTRQIFERPAIYEFAAPIGGSYPPWYDPTYWYEGFTIYFDPKEQMHALVRSIGAFLKISSFAQGGLLTGFLILFMMAGTPWRSGQDIARQWSILLPAIVALSMYALVRIEARYIAPFVVLFWIGLVSSIRLEETPASQRLVACVTLAMLLPMLGAIGAFAAAKGYAALRYAIRQDSPAHIQRDVAVFVHRLGVQPGDKVASIGRTFDANWAYLTQAQIVAEIPQRDAQAFWTGNEAVRAQALRAFGKTGAKLIVADKVPSYAAPLGWERIGDTDFYVYVLPAPSDGRRVIGGGVP
jgi:hypothetical protein